MNPRTPRARDVPRLVVAAGLLLALAQPARAQFGESAPAPAPAPPSAAPQPAMPDDTPAPAGQVPAGQAAAPPASEPAPGQPAEAPQIGSLPPTTATPGGSPPETAPPGPVSPEAGGPAPPFTIGHPRVVDTATLDGNGHSARLFGVTGQGGEAAGGLQAFIAQSGDRVTCQPQTAAESVCLLPDGTDIALAALLNGAAQARDDAPAPYRDEEAQAQAARRGMWAALPPPPAQLRHPIVEDTATLGADGQLYTLDGIEGQQGGFATDLQAYIAGHGDSLSCQPQGPQGDYLCRLPDGMDLAKIVLLNGAASVAPDAPDDYRVLQGQALAARRGIWLNPPPDLLIASEPSPGEVVAFGAVAGEPDDGITYVDGTPTAVIDGEAVAFVYAGPVGWGYYDHWHHWHGAPDHYWHHLDRFHPHGEHLRGYGERAHGYGVHEAAYRHADPAHLGGAHPVAGRVGAGRAASVAAHPNYAHAAAARPGLAGAAHPAPATFVHPAPGGFAAHAAPGGFAAHAAPGGFGGHPAAVGLAGHPALAAARAAPARSACKGPHC